MKHTLKPLLAALLAGLTTLAGATLVDRGGGMVYDTDRNLTWLQDWNRGAGSAYDDGGDPNDGMLTWTSAMAWAADLKVGAYDDWRLPSELNSDGTGPCLSLFAACTDTEMGHLWFVALGNHGVVNSNTGPFTHMLDHGSDQAEYWASTPFQSFATSFNMANGFASDMDRSNLGYAVAVRDGDVQFATNTVPEPGSLGLVLAALGMTLGLRRRAQAR